MLAKIKEFLGMEAKPEELASKEEVEKVAEEKAKPRIGYVHLSGCTGDVMSLSENYDILAELLTNMVEIVYGQTLADVWEMPEMDLVLVEGSVCLQDEHSVKELMEAREKAGLCSSFRFLRCNRVFHPILKRRTASSTQTMNHFVPIADLSKSRCAIPGCPPSPEIIAKTVVAVINGDMDYLQPMIDLVGYTEAFGSDLQYKVVNQALCIGCGTCAMACQTRALTMTNGRPEFNSARCVNCGVCYTQCPRSWWPAERIKQDLGL